MIIVLLLVVSVVGCKNILGPSDPIPGKSYDTVEFMYQRFFDIINPTGTDPNLAMWGERFSDGTVTGGNLSEWRSTESDQWQGWQVMYYSQFPHYVWTGDGKVRPGTAIATKFFARIQGKQNWIELSVEQNGLVGGEWARFFIDKNGIRNQ